MSISQVRARYACCTPNWPAGALRSASSVRMDRSAICCAPTALTMRSEGSAVRSRSKACFAASFAALPPPPFPAILATARHASSSEAAPRSLSEDASKQQQGKELKMPSAVTSDNVRLYYEEAGFGIPIIFLHEFAADPTNWDPPMRYFSRGHRCIAYSARGYTPSEVPPSADVYTYKHFYTDALAVLDHLGIAKAHLIGLSMGSYSSLQIGLNAPERALSMTLAAVGSGSNLENLDAFRKQCQANAEQYERIGSVEVAKATREAPSRIPFLLKDPRGHADFYAALARHSAQGSANTMRGFQGGRPSIYTMTDAIRQVPTPALILCGDEDDNCVEPSVFLKQHLPAAGLSFFPKSGHVLNLEEPALFNEMVERFIALVEAGRWPVRDPRSTVKVAV